MHAVETVFTVTAIVMLAVLGRAVLVFFSPYRECRWCRKGGLIGGSLIGRLAGHEPKRKRRGSCWRCKRTKQTRRLGARHVHKVKLSLLQAWEERGDSGAR
jgi:hypothetical protein